MPERRPWYPYRIIEPEPTTGSGLPDGTTELGLAVLTAASAADLRALAGAPAIGDIPTVPVNTAFGRSVLGAADAAALRTIADVPATADVPDPITTTPFGLSVVAAADADALRVLTGDAASGHSHGNANPYIVQSAVGGGSQDAPAALGAALIPGNVLLGIGTCRNGGPRLSFTGPSGLSALFAEVSNGGQGQLLAAAKLLTGGEATTVTVHSSGVDSPTAVAIECGRVSGVSYVFTGSSASSSAPAVTGSVTPNAEKVLVIEAFMCDWGEPSVAGTLTKGSSWTQLFKYDGAGYGPKYLVQYGVFDFNAIPVSGVAMSTAGRFVGTRIILQ